LKTTSILSANGRHAVLNISLVIISFATCFGQAAKEQKFKAAIKEIVQAFSKQDSAKLAAFIKKETGVYQLYRPGVYDAFEHHKTLGFSDSVYPKNLFAGAKSIQLLPLQYATLPAWNCEKNAWSKKGLFTDTTKISHLLSASCKYRNKYVPDNIPNQRIQSFYKLENVSRRIVLNDKNATELVFYLSFLDGKWYLTIIDNVSSDCGA
jgi:hypothetical protein